MTTGEKMSIGSSEKSQLKEEILLFVSCLYSGIEVFYSPSIYREVACLISWGDEDEK